MIEIYYTKIFDKILTVGNNAVYFLLDRNKE